MFTRSQILEKRRGVRIALVVLGTAVAMTLTWLILAPGPKKKVSADYKFMHCTSCGMERPYDAKLADGRCAKCRPPKVGYFEPTEKPLGPGGRSNPWRWFNSAIGVEAILFLGLLAYVIKPRQREEKVNYLYCNCPHCKWRLRFRDSLLGKGGQCPRCKRLFRFPEMEEADQEENPETEEQPAHW